MPAVEGAAMPRLTRAQQRQGLQILVELERVRDELAARHTELGPESWELLNDSRSERARDLLRAAEE